MKKTITLISFLLIGFTGSIYAQCSSSPGPYDLTVTGSVVIPPSGPSFTFGYVCAGGSLMDSAMCCTRLIHVEAGGIYEAGPSAYGMVYLKSGATFDAHGNNSFFGVAYEVGATILNYTGPMNLCPAVTFPASTCIPTGIIDEQNRSDVSIYPNPCNDVLNVDVQLSSKNAVMIIFDLTGKKVMETKIMNGTVNNQLNVSSVLPGMYSYSILDNNSLISQGKFTIIR